MDTNMIPVPDNITALDAAFGNTKHLPKWENIPEEFRLHWTTNKWCKLAEEWFYNGLKDLPKVKEGLDRKKVFMALGAILGSFEPKHEHKIAGVGFLMSNWLELDEKLA